MYSNFIFKIASDPSIICHISNLDSKATFFESNLTAFCPKAIDIAIGIFRQNINCPRLFQLVRSFIQRVESVTKNS